MNGIGRGHMFDVGSSFMTRITCNKERRTPFCPSQIGETDLRRRKKFHIEVAERTSAIYSSYPILGKIREIIDLNIITIDDAVFLALAIAFIGFVACCHNFLAFGLGYGDFARGYWSSLCCTIGTALASALREVLQVTV